MEAVRWHTANSMVLTRIDSGKTVKKPISSMAAAFQSFMFSCALIKA
jgi:hypothetical protein